MAVASKDLLLTLWRLTLIPLHTFKGFVESMPWIPGLSFNDCKIEKYFHCGFLLILFIFFFKEIKAVFILFLLGFYYL